jgi:hypothetical protein
MDLLNKADRELFLKDIKSSENTSRKSESLKAFEIYNDRIRKYVVDYLLGQYSKSTVSDYVIISSINLAKRIASKEASLYKDAPKRSFSGLTQDQSDELIKLYEKSEIDKCLFKANVYFKMQSQATLKVVAKNNKIDARALLPHHFDVIPSDEDPELAQTVVMNSYDKSLDVSSDMQNQSIADIDDYKKSLNKYIVWSDKDNFIFDGNGNTTGEVLPNPIGKIPFVDISGLKDFEYFVRSGQPLVDFTIQYNSALSDLQQLVKMQAFGVAILKTSKDLMPSSLTIGVNKVIHLPIDPSQPVQPDFGFVNAGADVSGSISAVENLLSNFLSSRGLDPKTINGQSDSGAKYNSGLDRLLGMISDLEANKQDKEVFIKAELDLFDLIKKWNYATSATDEAILSFVIPDNCNISVEYHSPEMIQSESDKLENIKKKLDLGIANKQMAIAEFYDLSMEDAEEKLLEIQSESSPDIVKAANDKAKKESVVSDFLKKVETNSDASEE